MHGFRKVNKSCFFMLLKHHFNVGLEHWTRKAFLGWYSVSVDSTCSVCVGNLKLRPYKSGRHWAFTSCGSVCDAVHVVRVAPCQVIWIPESGKCLEIPNPRLWKPESGIPLKIEIWVRVPLTENLESSTWNPESTSWNPESKTLLDYHTYTTTWEISAIWLA